MDKSWILKDRRSKDYEDGVEQFLNFAVIHATNVKYIRCPCTACGNLKKQNVNEIRNHLFFHGIDKTYQTWIWHGEAITGSTSDFVNVGDFQSDPSFVDDAAEAMKMVEDVYNHSTTDPDEFQKILEDAKKPLYPGCSKHSKISSIVKVLKFKARHRLSNVGLSDLLKMESDFLPENNEVPSAYEAEKIMTTLGLGYEKIHACPFDCVLYRKELKDANSCPTCHTSRWKLKQNSTEVRNGVPAKVLWYFSPIPRFLRMFQSPQTAKELTWHANQNNTDGQMRHPSDSPSWKFVDHTWPDFGAEPRNLRVAISADGINPYSSLNSKYSCWPVLMVIYNLPPWLCFKRKFMMLTMLISGPKQPGNDIDVYLAPLIDDLKLLWEVGVDAYDAYNKQNFKLKAILLWTINDFPAYGNLSGCKVKGYFACPICGEGTCSTRLKHGKKNVYMGHRKFLPRYHPYRKQKKAFDGKQEFGSAPKPLNGEEVLAKVKDLKTTWGKKVKNKSSNPALKCWTKNSIFNLLEYWKFMYVRHILDIMHIEKNICESILGTLLNIPGKTKDDKYGGGNDVRQLITTRERKKSELCKLAVGSPNNIVAHGTVYERVAPDEMIHTIPLGEKNVRVSVDHVIVQDALLPFPIPGEDDTVGGAIGFQLAWPKNLVSIRSDQGDPINCRVAPNERASIRYEVHDDEAISKKAEWVNNVECIKSFSSYVNHLTYTEAIGIELDKQMFGKDVSVPLYKEDMEHICHMEELAPTCIILYMSQLFNISKAANKQKKFIFVSPCAFSGTSKIFGESKAALLATRLSEVTSEQLVFVPCNLGVLWILVVIDLYSLVVYYLDSVDVKVNSSLQIVVNTALKIYETTKGNRRSSATWRVVKCPKQPLVVTSGFYVMRYMKDLLSDQNFLTKEDFNGKKTYTDAEIDEVRAEWISFVLSRV